MILEADISPVDSIVIIRSAEKLDLFKSGGARKGAGDGRMQAQEGMEGRCTWSGNSIITKSAAHRLEEEEEEQEEQEMAAYLFSVALRSGTWAAGRRFSLLTRYLCVSCHDRDSKKKNKIIPLSCFHSHECMNVSGFVCVVPVQLHHIPFILLLRTSTAPGPYAAR